MSVIIDDPAAAEEAKDLPGARAAIAKTKPDRDTGPSRTLPPLLAEQARHLADKSACRRMLFVTGGGDVRGTHRYWTEERDDPSIPALAYSAQIYELAEALGVDLTVLSDIPLSGPEEADGTRFRYCAMTPARGLRYHLAELGYALRVIRHALATRADTVLLQRHLTHFWPMALARLFGIRILVSLHNTLWPIHRAPSRRERLVNRLNGWFFRRTAGVICVSKAIQRQVQAVARSTRVRTRVQAPQYKAELAGGIQPCWKEQTLSHLLYLGRIEDNKGVFHLLDAFTMAAEAHPHLRLRFIGDGSALERLRRATAALAPKIARRIEIPGKCDGAQIFRELGQADLLVCPTTGDFAEGLAKTPVEAALVGVPSVITSVVPVAETLGEAAEVVETDNISALAATLDHLARNPARLAAMSRATGICRAQFFDREKSLASQLLLCLEADHVRERKPQAAVSDGTPVLGWKATSG